MKRKATSTVTGMSPNFTTPTRRSRRVPITLEPNRPTIISIHNYSNPPSQSPNNFSKQDSQIIQHNDPGIVPSLPIHSSSISYRVLLPHDIFRLDNNSQVVLVVNIDSYGFRKSIAQYLDYSTLSNHSREQDGFIKYEFVMKIGAFSIRDSVLNGSINDAEQVLRYNQGDGLTLISTQYKGIKYLVRFKDIFTGQIQLFEKVDSNQSHPDFFAAAGRSQDPRVYGPIYQAFFRMVHGDSEQTLRVLVAYYRQKTESLVDDPKSFKKSD